ncbi:MAG: 16S rRNA (guanine(966)-N(2))-methyltransferase RsmD [Clostridia bacterium]|nr:16S rRNA (guanine(966)-N(2))-methyltransferase RsmD [Clostridia bacterium]
MRIITGIARGTKLETLDSDATRPTSDKVKEAIFSMIQFEIEGRRVLDLFGGSGQLALEALSRGADKATIIDESREAVNVIINNAKHAKLYDKCRISAISYSAFLKSFSEDNKYNIVFLDPPYASDMMHDSLKLLAQYDVTAMGASIICESETVPSKKKNHEKKDPDKLSASVLSDVFAGDTELMEKYNLERSSVYGRTRITVLTKK